MSNIPVVADYRAKLRDHNFSHIFAALQKGPPPLKDLANLHCSIAEYISAYLYGRHFTLDAKKYVPPPMGDQLSIDYEARSNTVCIIDDEGWLDVGFYDFKQEKWFRAFDPPDANPIRVVEWFESP